jgi:hypothetical protein
VDDLLKIVERVNKAIRSDKSKRTALTTTLAINKQRIFVNGLDANGSKIGTYSKKYGEYKSKLGRNPGYVNLTNTGQMFADYGLIVNGDTYGFGFQNDFNFNKSQWAQDKYEKEIFELSDKELDVFVDVYLEELNKEM